MEHLEINIEQSPEQNEIVQAFLADIGFDSFADTETGCKAYIDETQFKSEELDELQQQFTFTYSVDKLPQKNWNEEWEKNFQPITVGNKCHIRADFHPKVKDVAYEIIITPKMSFGTGHHATTHMAVNQMFALPIKEASVLDMGCGTSVLAILAAKLGASKVVGIDYDEWAVNNSIENVEKNGYPDMEIHLGDASILSKFEKFDVILANINRNILLEDMHAYAAVLTKTGTLVCSGFYTEDNDLIINEAAKFNLTLHDQNERDNWSLLEFKRGI